MKKTLFSYLKERMKFYILLGCFLFIFLFIFYLAELASPIVWYAFFLCGILFLLASLLDFHHFYKKRNLIKALSIHPEIASDLESFPGTMCEKELIAIIEEQRQEQMRIRSKTDAQFSDMVDYYTMWAHQIKTPISAMHLMLQESENEQYRELLMELMKIDQYVDMVLQYLRLDSESSDFVFQTYSLDQIICTAIKKYAPLFIRKKITLKYKTIDQMITTDEKWFQFILEQLLSNALKYTAKGSISIQMKSEKLVIMDTGIGIAPEDIPRVFDKGFTGFNGRIGKKSTGIGLYLCKRVSQKLGCELSIYSKIGEGTSVSFSLPKEKPEIE